MKSKIAPLNEVYLQGAVELMFLEYEQCLPLFVDSLHGLTVKLKKGDEPNHYKAYIYFAIKGDEREYTDIYLLIKKDETPIESLRLQIIDAAEIISRKVNRFNSGTATGNNDD